MAWQTTLVTMVRHLVNDLGGSNEFDESRIRESIVVAGIIVSQEYSFDHDYTFDLDSVDISPDPVSKNDNAAVALISLRSACMLDTNKYQSAVKNGVRIREGDSQIDTTGSFQGYRDILQSGPCGSYKKLLSDLSHKKSMSLGGAVMTPITHIDLSYSNHGADGLRYFFDRLT